jgi:hypothetical protein
MIELAVFGETPSMLAAAECLDRIDGVTRLRIEPAFRAGRSLVFARVGHDVTDEVLERLLALGVSQEDLTLSRVEELGGGATSGAQTSLIWADVIGLAGSTSRLVARYLTFMGVAGVIACYGVVTPIRSWSSARWPSARTSSRSPRPR